MVNWLWQSKDPISFGYFSESYELVDICVTSLWGVWIASVSSNKLITPLTSYTNTCMRSVGGASWFFFLPKIYVLGPITFMIGFDYSCMPKLISIQSFKYSFRWYATLKLSWINKLFWELFISWYISTLIVNVSYSTTPIKYFSTATGNSCLKPCFLKIYFARLLFWWHYWSW